MKKNYFKTYEVWQNKKGYSNMAALFEKIRDFIV